MDDARFDALARSLTAGRSRRGVLRAAAAAALGALFGARAARDAAAACREAGRRCGDGRRCCEGGRCIRRHCRCSVSRDFFACDGPGARCVNVATSEKHCGGCGNPPCDPEQNQVCRNGGCVDACRDGLRDGLESDVDCGGPLCPGCEFGHTCDSPDDCANGLLFCRDRAGDGTAGKVCVECADGAIPADDACLALHGEARPFCVRDKCRQCRDEADCEDGEECRDGVCEAAGSCAGKDFCQDVTAAGCRGDNRCACLQTIGGEALCALFAGGCFSCDVDSDCDLVTGAEGSACVAFSGPHCSNICPDTNNRACVPPCPTDP